jgi:hypothetical protein
MPCEGKYKLRSHNASYYLMDVVTTAGLTVYYSNGIKTTVYYIIQVGLVLLLSCIFHFLLVLADLLYYW